MIDWLHVCKISISTNKLAANYLPSNDLNAKVHR